MDLHTPSPTAKSPDDWFTGDVYVTPIYQGHRTVADDRRPGASLPAHAATGTPTTSARPCTSARASAWSASVTAPSSASAPATLLSARPERRTGTEPARTPL